MLTLGDFWTGNVLVASGSDITVSLYVVDLELAKPGTAEFDVGQMGAEMYCFEYFRDQRTTAILLVIISGGSRKPSRRREGSYQI